MSKCTLSIEVPGHEESVAPGDELQVIVHVSCDKTIKCNGLSLTRGWRTHGKGNRDQGGKRMEELFRGSWEPGEYSYPTTVTFPERPTSYHGTAINVDWYLEARADVPLAFDPKTELMVLVVDPTLPKPYTPPELWAPQPVKLASGASGCMILSFISMPFTVALMFLKGPSWGTLLIPAGIMAYTSIRKGKAAIQAVGQVAVEVYPSVIAPGEELHVMVEVHPEQSVQIEHITITLMAMESATSGSGTDTTTYREEVFKLEQVLGKDLQLSPTNRFDEEATFVLPITAPLSFEESDNEIITTLKLEVQPVDQKLVTYTEIIHVGPVIDSSDGADEA